MLEGCGPVDGICTFFKKFNGNAVREFGVIDTSLKLIYLECG